MTEDFDDGQTDDDYRQKSSVPRSPVRMGEAEPPSSDTHEHTKRNEGLRNSQGVCSQLCNILTTARKYQFSVMFRDA